jgi:hypothetical protein
MAFHFKSTTKFKALIGFSALAVSGVAAIFSVTGVSTLFKGAWLTVVLMMSILEFAKIVVASYIARFWPTISKTLKTYFTIAIIVLMVITSAGIFGYLSEAYQKTKGNYDVTEQESVALTSKKQSYEEQMTRYKERVNTLNSFRASQEIRLDSLYIRGLTTSAKRVEQGIQRNDAEVQLLNDKITALTDSVGSINTQIITKQSVNIKGELGPLKFIATAFNTDMDNVVKYLIFMLIFVFDPLAVLLFVSLSVMIRKEVETEITNVKNNDRKEAIIPLKMEGGVIPKSTPYLYSEVKVKDIPKVDIEEPKVEIESKEEKELKEVVEMLNPKIELDVEEVARVEEPVEPKKKEQEQTLVEQIKEEPVEEVPDKVEEQITNQEEVNKEHAFYYGSEQTSSQIPNEPSTAPPSTPSIPEWHTANWKPPHK